MAATYAKTCKPASRLVVDDPRWARIAARDRTADGHLWYSVSTGWRAQCAAWPLADFIQWVETE
jgi:methylphosphotriester-DNA--protein-cysteine methyltransferase